MDVKSRLRSIEIRARRVGWILNGGLISRVHAAERLDVFFPSSANGERNPEMTFLAASSAPAQLWAISSELDRRSTQASSAPQGVYSMPDFIDTPRSQHLAALLDSHGSDKGRNGYAPIYAAILDSLPTRQGLRSTIVEVGLGTRNPLAVSTMGRRGRPGASLFAFSRFLPEATFIGIDIDPDALISAPRIRSVLADQTNLTSLEAALSDIPALSLPLLVDDGLHSPLANLNTLIIGLRLVAPMGFIVIEDIPERTRPLWELVLWMFRVTGHEARLWQATQGKPYVFVTRLSSS